MGGWSSEREVSLSSAKGVVSALETLGYNVRPIDVKKDLPALIKDLTPYPDVIFNALHGTGGEDGVIQGILETLGIPYTHSGVMSSSVAMNKVLSRKVFEYHNLPVPEWKVVSKQELNDKDPFEPPYV